MNMQRRLIVLLTLMFLPVAAFAQIPITPAPGTALVGVVKVWEDGNDETPVSLTLECTSGSIAPASITIPPGSLGYHFFVVSQIPLGPDNVCKVKETPVPGYDSFAFCLEGGSPNPDCQPTAPEDDYLGYCQFDNVQAGNGDNIPGDVALCFIINEPTPVEVEVTKMWDITNAGAAGDDYSLFAEIIVGCDSGIIDSTWKKNGWTYKKFYLDDSDYTAGEATVTVEVYPDYEGNECFAVEDDVDSAVEVSSDCGSWNNGTMEIGIGQGDSCTITNTLFFEGIPTLNQYGMAIMALLMLGVGFVGFRRFV
jgi:hypothetical protein